MYRPELDEARFLHDASEWVVQRILADGPHETISPEERRKGWFLAGYMRGMSERIKRDVVEWGSDSA